VILFLRSCYPFDSFISRRVLIGRVLDLKQVLRHRKRGVQTALARLRRGRTTIVIAHCLSTVRDADLSALDHMFA